MSLKVNKPLEKLIKRYTVERLRVTTLTQINEVTVRFVNRLINHQIPLEELPQQYYFEIKANLTFTETMTVLTIEDMNGWRQYGYDELLTNIWIVLVPIIQQSYNNILPNLSKTEQIHYKKQLHEIVKYYILEYKNRGDDKRLNNQMMNGVIQNAFGDDPTKSKTDIISDMRESRELLIRYLKEFGEEYPLEYQYIKGTQLVEDGYNNQDINI